ncbi:MAG: diacylglycerol kinase [Halanaerobiales bacterium]
MQVDNFWGSLNYALQGIIHTFKTQRNMRIHFSLAFIVLVGSLLLDVSKLELLALFFAIVFVLGMELINTSVEIIVDMITDRYSYRARIAKNIAAGAVFLASVNAMIVGYLIFLDELKELSLSLIQYIKQNPSHLTFINLGLLFLIVISMKAATGKGTPLRGGMPSGHSALAFSIMAMVALLTEDFLLTTLVFILAIFVAQSRLHTRTHSFLEVVTGGLIGVLLTLIIFQLL